MPKRARDLRVEVIRSRDAARVIKALHYSGKVCQNSQLHFGVFLEGRCGGAMSFGPAIDKRRSSLLVRGTQMHQFLELNRLALADWLPRNSESRALRYAMRWIRREHPCIKWIQSFADATQCGDGTIYRAAGFLLARVKRNTSLLRLADGRIVADKTLNNTRTPDGRTLLAVEHERGAKPLPGFQMLYVAFLDPSWRDRLTVEPLPFSEIRKRGASMYLGKSCVGGADGGTPAIHAGGGGSTPTSTLHLGAASSGKPVDISEFE